MIGAEPMVGTPWTDAALAAAACVVDASLGGAAVRAAPGPVRDEWIALFQDLLPDGAPVRRVPTHVHDDRLLGGLDLVATLRAGRPVAERGLLAEADGGLVVLAGSERMGTLLAARLAAVLDTGEVVVERDGVASRADARFVVAAFDEGCADDERPPAVLLERLAVLVDLEHVGVRETFVPSRFDQECVAAARERLPRVAMDSAHIEALCATALALGIASMRAPIFAARVARTVAALEGRDRVLDTDAAVAARLVLAPRATRLPYAEPEEQPPGTEAPPEPPTDGEAEASSNLDRPLEDVVLAAATAAIPPGLLAQLKLGGTARPSPTGAGRAGEERHGGTRGRPAGVRRGEPRRGARLHIVETLRAAAPWQAVRRRMRASAATAAGVAPRIEVRPTDFRVQRHRHRARTTTIFVVDASGSAALHRLAEAKGAVELLLAECYVRRDRVALVAFRGRAAELVLPPTRSLVRAKRCLAGLPGGGGTPLAAGIESALALAEAMRRQGDTPVLVFLTDGRANVTREGTPDREAAHAQSIAAARRLLAARLRAILVDTAPRAQPQAERIADAMGARYLPLPHARSRELDAAIRGAARG